MKKIRRVLSLTALGMQLLSLLLYFGTILLQTPIKKLFELVPEVVSTFSFPIVETLSALGLTALIALLALLAPRVKSILPEIAGIVLLALWGTLLHSLLASLEMSILGNMVGANYLISLSVLTSYIGISGFLSDVAKALALTLCGMSMVMKKATKRPAQPQQKEATR